MLIANTVSAVPIIDTDCDAHRMVKVRKPCGGVSWLMARRSCTAGPRQPTVMRRTQGMRRPVAAPLRLPQSAPHLGGAALAGLDAEAVLQAQHQHAVLAAVGLDRVHVDQGAAMDAHELAL